MSLDYQAPQVRRFARPRDRFGVFSGSAYTPLKMLTFMNKKTGSALLVAAPLLITLLSGCRRVTTNRTRN
jgi:hypothetical protein